jgi:hypothetical protein
MSAYKNYEPELFLAACTIYKADNNKSTLILDVECKKLKSEYKKASVGFFKKKYRSCLKEIIYRNLNVLMEKDTTREEKQRARDKVEEYEKKVEYFDKVHLRLLCNVIKD